MRYDIVNPNGFVISLRPGPSTKWEFLFVFEADFMSLRLLGVNKIMFTCRNVFFFLVNYVYLMSQLDVTDGPRIGDIPVWDWQVLDAVLTYISEEKTEMLISVSFIIHLYDKDLLLGCWESHSLIFIPGL